MTVPRPTNLLEAPWFNTPPYSALCFSELIFFFERTALQTPTQPDNRTLDEINAPAAYITIALAPENVSPYFFVASSGCSEKIDSKRPTKMKAVTVPPKIIISQAPRAFVFCVRTKDGASNA